MNMNESRVFIRQPVASDAAKLLDLHQRSQHFHRPWAFPPLTAQGCQHYIERCQQDNFEGLLICSYSDSQLIGVVNFSQIFYGSFQNAYLGYYADVQWAGQGLMTEGLRQAIDYAFQRLKLHRLESNIQPQNQASIALVKRLGFRREGFSPRYLKLNGAWRDHERWAITAEEWP